MGSSPNTGRNTSLGPGPGPTTLTALTGSSSSQPNTTEAQRLLSKYRRIASDRAAERGYAAGEVAGEAIWYSKSIGLPEKEYVSVLQLRKAVLGVIVERLKARQIPSQRLTEMNLSWCLPQTLDQEIEWRLLLEDPLVVPTHILSNMIKLNSSDPDTAPLPEGSVSLYIRELQMQVEDMNNVLNSMLHDGYDMNPHIFYWMERVQDMADVSYVTLRYIGQTKNKPWDRHQSDIYSVSLRSFLGHFLRTAGMVCPWVLQQAKVFVVSEASSSHGAPMSQDHIDAQEQALIALFGDGVLNTDYGGKEVIALTNDDRDVFVTLQSSTIKELTKLRQCAPFKMQSLRNYAGHVRGYVQNNRTTTQGKKDHKFTQATERMLSLQGAWRTLQDGSAVMVSLGSDLGDTHEDGTKPFFESGGRSAEIATLLYNHFGHWEQGIGSSFDEFFTKNLATNSQLPFVDYFPWFVKHQDDWNAASLLCAEYMNLAKPYIVLSYGNIPGHAAMNNFASFSEREFLNHGATMLRAHGTGYWVKEILGVPKLLAFNRKQGTTVDKEFVLIPCYHPGIIGHAGVMKEKAARLLALVFGLAWDAMGLAIRLNTDDEGLTRKQKCEQLIVLLQSKMDENHAFGRAFAQAKKEYLIATTADFQARLARKQNLPIGKPPRGILPAKTQRSRRDQFDRNPQTEQGLGQGFEVEIRALPNQGVVTKDKPRYCLRWTEDDGQGWAVEPLYLPDNTAAKDSSDKRFLVYTSTGIDLRNNAGNSVGDRKPLVTGAGKSVTLPIAVLALMLHDQATGPVFFSHWEEITGCSVNEVLASTLPISSEESSQSHTANETYYPAAFFEQSHSKRGLPLVAATGSSFMKPVYNTVLSQIKKTLPANPGDLLWLLDRFFLEMFPNGGEVDLVSASVHSNSVYKQVAMFCAKATYKHHPHRRTLLALGSMAEMGMDERIIPAHALTLATDILRGPYTKRNKTANLTIAGEKRSTSRAVLTFKNARPDGVINEVDEPQLMQDVIVEEDVTDDEEDNAGDSGAGGSLKRRYDDDDDDDDFDDDFDDELGLSKASAKMRRIDQETEMEI